MMKRYTALVVGGAGYIGSHMVKMLSKLGHRAIVFDNLSTGFADAAIYADELVVGDLADQELLDKTFDDYEFDGVIHFAAASLVGESTINPSKYYRNNVSNTLNLLDVMLKHGVKNLVFSSTAAIFGEPEYTPIDERHPKKPISPYGASKLMIERVLEDFSVPYGLNSVSLRYFNACGADPEGDLGERHEPETHLIPLLLQVASGRRESVSIFGNDYPTPDGTCVRDYIHVADLCDAHLKSLSAMLNGQLRGAHAFNLGNGNGFSVREVIQTVSDVVAVDDKQITVIEQGRRVGDPAILVATSKRAHSELSWRPEYSSIERMIADAWRWEKGC